RILMASIGSKRWGYDHRQRCARHLGVTPAIWAKKRPRGRILARGSSSLAARGFLASLPFFTSREEAATRLATDDTPLALGRSRLHGAAAARSGRGPSASVAPGLAQLRAAHRSGRNSLPREADRRRRGRLQCRR